MKVIYTGIFFDFTDEERYVLQQIARAEGMPNQFLHHVTLCFRPKKDSEHLLRVQENLGRVCTLTITGATGPRQFEDSGAAALQVELDPWLAEAGIECANAVPHLTVATEEGISPARSNKAVFKPLSTWQVDMLVERSYDPATGNPTYPGVGRTIKGRLGVFRNEVGIDLGMTAQVLGDK